MSREINWLWQSHRPQSSMMDLHRGYYPIKKLNERGVTPAISSPWLRAICDCENRCILAFALGIIATTCGMILWRNYINCKYMFILLVMSLACKWVIRLLGRLQRGASRLQGSGGQHGVRFLTKRRQWAEPKHPNKPRIRVSLLFPLRFHRSLNSWILQVCYCYKYDLWSSQRWWLNRYTFKHVHATRRHGSKAIDAPILQSDVQSLRLIGWLTSVTSAS